MNDEKFFLLRFLRTNKQLSIACCAREIGCSPKTASHWLKANIPPSVKRPRKMNETRRVRVEHRRALVVRLANETDTLTRVKYSPVIRKPATRVIQVKKFPTPAAISREMTRRRMPVSATTIRRDLLRNGFKARRQRAAPYLTEKHKTERMKFCKKRLPRLLFSDEKLMTSNNHSNGWEWVTKDQRPLTRGREQGPARVLLWACIGVGFRHLAILPTGSITKKTYQELCLKPCLAQLKAATRNAYFSQDNARPHLGSAEYLRKNGVRVLEHPWPALSPDLNPTEQIWQWLSQRVSASAPYGEESLTLAIKQAWFSIPQSAIDDLCGSFPMRRKKVVAANGDTIQP